MRAEQTGESSDVTFITRWDLDRTHLRTELEMLGELWQRAVEPPNRQRSVPGATTLLRELKSSGACVHIISASPRHLRPALEAKLGLDRVVWDELTPKPSLGKLVRMRWRRLRDQVGHKLSALLEARARDQQLAPGAHLLPEVLVGDDAEADAFLYSLYADILTGRVDRALLKRVLQQGRAYSDQMARCLEAVARLSHGPVVERILIHLERQTPPSNFNPYRPRLVPFYNYLQAAFVLAEDGRIGAPAVLRVASVFALRHRFDWEALARSYLDLLRRGHVHGAIVQPLRVALPQSAAVDPSGLEPLSRMCDCLEDYVRDPPALEHHRGGEVDYFALARRHAGPSGLGRLLRLL
jgi:hypothetical protein